MVEVNSKYEVPNSVEHSIFRSNDIRGTYPTTLNCNTVYAIGLAIGSEIKIRKHNKVVVARDGRLSSPTLSKALTQGLLNSGCDVYDIGAVPTPVLYFATQVLHVSSGVMLTGSHNPQDDNGLKIVLEGKTASEEEILAFLEHINNKNFSKGTGKYTELELIKKYTDKVHADIKIKRKLKIVIDCGNGIAGVIAPNLFKELGCDTTKLFCDVDGTFPNHHPDPSSVKNLEHLIKTVKKEKADIGLAFDGDGDRVGVVTNSGKIIWPDRLLMLFAKDVLKHNPGSTIIYDIKCTNHLKPFIEKHNGKALMWKTGHSYIKAKLREIDDAVLAGEMSGHFFFNERWYGFDDAIYSAARLLEILSNSTQSLDEIFDKIPDSICTPELNIKIPDSEKFKFIDDFRKKAVFKGGKITTLDGLRVDFDYGFGLVRASRTTPCLVLRFEAYTSKQLEEIKSSFKQQILSVNSKLKIPF